jgi:ferredoxin-nitrite reductase
VATCGRAVVNMDEFNEEQKNYLQGFASGIAAARAARGLPGFAAAPAAKPAQESEPAGPEAIHTRAQNRFLESGKKLCPEEMAKRAKNPLDMWDDINAFAREKRVPKGTDVLLFKFHGLFYVAPAQDSFMCRLRLPNGILSSHQLCGVASIAEDLAGGYSHVTTRANLQLREIAPENTVKVLTALCELGLTSRGSGADNIRNITGDPTAGIAAQELIDTRPLCRELHHYILNHREMYGLPRKFNIAFDGGGPIPVLEDTNDIAFNAVQVCDGKATPPGVYFRMALGGITGHGDFARDIGILLTPEQCVPAAAAVVRVFIENGDRTDRRKARMKYVIDRFGLEKYMEEVEKLLPFKPLKIAASECEPRPPVAKHGHIGFHRQRQSGFYYAGVVLPVGKLTVAQMRGLADIAERFGRGAIRLTVWQNLLISDIPEDRMQEVEQAIEALGLSARASSIRAGLVACTGNRGCRFSASDTKGHAEQIAQYLEPRVRLDQPVNIHLTGCPHSCAQHYIGDIGLLGAKVDAGEDSEVEGYHVYVGGGYGAEQELARELYRDVAFEDVPPLVERMLDAYLAQRESEAESFREFSKRHSVEMLRAMLGERAVPRAAGELTGSEHAS